MLRRLRDERSRQQLHPALRAVVSRIADDVRMHRADVAARRRGEQLHPTLRAPARLFANDLRMHRAGVDDGSVGRAHVHLGDEGKGLVRRCVEVAGEPLALRHPLRIAAQGVELAR